MALGVIDGTTRFVTFGDGVGKDFSMRDEGRWSGVPSARSAANGMTLQATVKVPLLVGRRSKRQWGYQPHGEGERK